MHHTLAWTAVDEDDWCACRIAPHAIPERNAIAYIKTAGLGALDWQNGIATAHTSER